MKRILLIMVTLLLISGLTMPSGAESGTTGYRLDRMVVLSRHNIRSPMSGSGSLLGDITPHEWFHWTSQPSELSLRGAVLETEMGQYFRLWLEREGLFPENYRPENGAVRFYANAKQRTRATAKCFAAGLLPVADTEIESHGEYDTMDPTFTPKLTFLTEAYEQDVIAQITESGGPDGLRGIHEKLAPALSLLMDVTDMRDSAAYQAGRYSDLTEGETSIVLALDKEPSMTGPIRTGTSLADALILQYYEETDARKAAFGHELTEADWQLLHSIVDRYSEMLFAAPLVSVHVAHPLLLELRAELTAEGRQFSFLCGHDSNLASVLSALGAEEYLLPGTVEQHTPIGAKLAFERWLAPDGAAYYTIELVYQSTAQLRALSLLSLEEPPLHYGITLRDVPVNADGMIAEADLLALFDRTISAYDEMYSHYTGEAALEPAA